MTRYRTTGQGTPWIVHPGYKHQSKPWAKLQRPEGELSRRAGVGLLGLIAVLATLAATLIP